MDELAKIRALTGITPEQISDSDLETILEFNDGRVYCAAADAADRMGTALISGAGVTAVEDISIDRRRVIDGWRALADRLRKRCLLEAAEEADDGPAVVEFHPWGRSGPEAVEHGYS